MINFKELFYELKYVLLFYVLLDFISTYIAIEYGFAYEGNPILYSLIESYTIFVILFLKILFLFLISIVYLRLKKEWHINVLGIEVPKIWHYTKHSVAFFGFVLFLNNTFVIFQGINNVYI